MKKAIKFMCRADYSSWEIKCGTKYYLKTAWKTRKKHKPRNKLTSTNSTERISKKL